MPSAGQSKNRSLPTPTQQARIVELAVPCPLYRVFDYVIPDQLSHKTFQPGCRVRVKFGRQSVIAIVVTVKDHTDVPAKKLKAAEQLLDEDSLLPDDIFKLLIWSARYYNQPLGEVFQAALPVKLRQLDHAEVEQLTSWVLSTECRQQLESIDDNPKHNPVSSDRIQLAQLKRAPKQQQLVDLLHQKGNLDTGLTADQLNELTENWRSPMQALIDKGLVNTVTQPAVITGKAKLEAKLSLNDAQQTVVSAIQNCKNSAAVHVIDGITGSGKTEVYIELCRQHLDAGHQILIMVPEIGLTPQITARFRQQLNASIAVLHSGMNDTQRHAAWDAASKNQAQIIIGTRSSIFTPMPSLGLIIIDEEHDASFKQQDGFRYNARDLAIVRAKTAEIPIVLGSATPSLETLNNVQHKRFILHPLKQRANKRPLPKLKLLNACSQKLVEGIAEGMLDEVKKHLEQDGQVLLFLNRRGFSPLLMCHDCGWTTRCHSCDAHMTYHKRTHRLHCHHCGTQQAAPDSCEECDSENIIAIGAGTERIEQYLQSRFPDTDIIRIDRDTTRRKGSLEASLKKARESQRSILIGTQMLAKGHDFPNITLVGILDTDQSLFSSDFRATENLAQLIIQVAGRAGRAQRTGEVMIQTHHPEHPLLQQLLSHGYEAFARAALLERQQTGLPPYQPMAMLRSESTKAGDAINFLSQCRQLCESEQVKTLPDEISLFGPLSAPMERRAGRYRYQLMLQSMQRKSLQQLLNWLVPQLDQLPGARKARWSIDVDPYDTY